MKLNDAVLKELVELEAKAKELASRIDEIKSACKEKGSFGTANYVCVVSTQSRTGLAGLKDVAAVVGQKILEQNNLIKTTEYKVVKVEAKISSVVAAVQAAL